jgi:hypothetical protein
MSEMIERVARAVMITRQAAAGPIPSMSLRVMQPSAFDFAIARAAIEAMREPTEGMVLAGGDVEIERVDGEALEYHRLDGACARAWKTMIDAALQER